MNNNGRLRRAYFTWNNYEDDFKDRDELIKYFEELPHFKGAVLGFEIGEETGTRHINGVIFFNTAKTFYTLRDYLKNNHIEKIRYLNEVIEYCKKDGDYIELGELPRQGQRKSTTFNFIEAIRDGYTDEELMLQFPHLYLNYRNQIHTIRNKDKLDYYSVNNRDLKVYYVGGVTGIGKSYNLYQYFNHDDIYKVVDYKNSFDKYKTQNVLIFEEYNADFNIKELLNLLDIYPTELRARYNNKIACYNVVIINSNYSFNDMIEKYSYYNDEQIKALKRRFTDINFFNTREDLSAWYEKTFNLDLPF